MNNTSSIEEIIERIQERYNSPKGFEELKLLLLDSGVGKDDAHSFFMMPEGENFPIGISSYALKEKLAKDNSFFEKLAINLYSLSDPKRKEMLAYAFTQDGLTLEGTHLYNKNKIVFEVHYNDIDRVVRVNDRIIAKPRFNQENDNVFSHLFKNPNKLLSVDQHDKLDGEVEVLKSLDDVVKNLQFSGEARRLFFPKVSDKEIEFRNPITLGELRARGFSQNLTINDLFPDKKTNSRDKKDK